MNIDLSSSLQDYLKYIYLENMETAQVRISQIAKRMQVKKASVVSAIKKLVTKQLVRHEPYGAIELTQTGLTTAEVIYRRHLVLNNFFSNILNLPEIIAEKDACAAEHTLSRSTIDRIIELTNFLEKENCDQGSIIANYIKHHDLLKNAEIIALSSLEKGEAVMIDSLSDCSASLRQKLISQGVITGEILIYEGSAPLGDPLKFKIKDRNIMLRKQEARLINCKRV
jgi:DtxR family Mn-dependent transcriptional regulator